MNLLEVLSTKEEREEYRSRICGVVLGIVTNNQDPDGLGRVKVKFPWLAERDESNWARVVSPMAGAERGMVFIPEVNDEVLVAFDHCDVRAPYVMGALWNGIDKLPKKKQTDDQNNLRIIESRSHHILIFDDTSGSEKIQIVDKTEKNQIIIDSSSNKLTLQVEGDIELKAANGKIKLEAKSVEIKSSAETKIEAGSTMDAKASGTMTIKGATVNIN